MNIDFAQDLGSRSTQEDRFVLQIIKDGLAAHVLDGHGGSDAVDCCATCLEHDLLPRFNPKEENEEIVRGLQNMCGNYEKQGTTLSSVYIFGDKIYVSILGDSPCFILKDGKIQALPVHDISNKEEMKLRMEAGASRSLTYPKHILNSKGQGLSTFRTIGDTGFEEIVGRVPEWHEIKEGFDEIILCSDGLKMTPKQILGDYSEGAEGLIQLNREKNYDKKLDNTTVIIISR